MSSSPGNTFLEKGAKRIGSRYKKAVYREYTSDTFKVQKKRKPSEEHLGILGQFCFWLLKGSSMSEDRLNITSPSSPSAGPLIKAEVGEQIVITFKNKASRPYSIAPYGVRASGAHVPVPPGEGKNPFALFPREGSRHVLTTDFSQCRSLVCL